MTAIEIGPFVLAWPRFAAIAAACVLLGAAEVIGRFAGARAALAGWAFAAVLWGALGGRAAHVAEAWQVYAAAPHTVLYIWQGGFAPWGTGLALGLVTLRGWRTGVPLMPALGALAVAGATWGALVHDTASPPPRALPDLRLARLEGGAPLDLGALAGRGKPVVINLWATWCPPCRRELPMMLEMAAARDDVIFVFASQREAGATVAGMLARAGLPAGPVVLDPEGRLSAHYGAAGLPVTLVHGPDGRLVRAHLGEISQAGLLAAIAAATPR